MDCKKAQQLFDDLSRERLAPETAVQVRRHLADCYIMQNSKPVKKLMERLKFFKRIA